MQPRQYEGFTMLKSSDLKKSSTTSGSVLYVAKGGYFLTFDKANNSAGCRLPDGEFQVFYGIENASVAKRCFVEWANKTEAGFFEQ